LANPLGGGFVSDTSVDMRRILAIDGGWDKRGLPDFLLTALEGSIGDKVSNYCDLIVGTSTGGILALRFDGPISGASILREASRKQFTRYVSLKVVYLLE